jgi:hypothetical protein
MINPRILARGTFLPGDIDVTYNDVSNRATTPEIERAIDEHWEVFFREAKAAGKSIWNGVTYRVNDLKVADDGKLNVEFAPIDFKTRESVLSIPNYYELPERFWRKGATVGSFVKTVDNFYVFVALSGRSVSMANPNKKVSLIGGVLDEDVPVRASKDIYETMYKEFEEESAVPRDRVKRCILDSVYLSPSTNIGFHFIIDLFETKEEVEARFKAESQDDDIAGLLFVAEADMPAQLRKMGGMIAFLGEVYFA